VAKRGRGGDTRGHILRTALGLFRDNGFDDTTMRDIARAASMSLGAAYYYFPSKDAIVLAFYEQVSAQRAAQAEALFAETDDLGERVRGLYQLHFDLVAEDRPLLNALVRSVADPDSPLSVFSEQTRHVRGQTLTLFDRALDVDGVPDALRDLGTLGLWTLDLGLMLYFVWDQSPGQTRTRKLVDDAVTLLLPLIPLLGTPLAAPVVAHLAQMLIDADLVPDEPGDGEPGDDEAS
jgi:AcrR family transcriptional regulator